MTFLDPNRLYNLKPRTIEMMKWIVNYIRSSKNAVHTRILKFVKLFCEKFFLINKPCKKHINYIFKLLMNMYKHSVLKRKIRSFHGSSIKKKRTTWVYAYSINNDVRINNKRFSSIDFL